MDSKTDKILERIRKLLRMASDASSPNEAAIAANRARKLMDEYQISEWDISQATRSDFGEGKADTGFKSFNEAISRMGYIIAKLNDCESKWGMSQDNTAVMIYMGLLSDAITAMEMHNWLLMIMWNGSKPYKGMKSKSDYRNGFVSGLAETMKQMIADREDVKMSNGKGLVVAKQALIQQHFGIIRYKKGKRNYDSSSSAFSSGYRDGKRQNLRR